MTHKKQSVEEGLARRHFTRAGASVCHKLKRLSIVSIAFIVPLSLGKFQMTLTIARA